MQNSFSVFSFEFDGDRAEIQEGEKMYTNDPPSNDDYGFRKCPFCDRPRKKLADHMKKSPLTNEQKIVRLEKKVEDLLKTYDQVLTLIHYFEVKKMELPADVLKQFKEAIEMLGLL